MPAALDTRTWHAGGLDCPSCAATLERACRAVPGVADVRIDLAGGRLQIDLDPASFDEAALRRAARDAGHPLRATERAALRADPLLWLATALLAVAVALELAGRSTAWLYVLPVAGVIVPLARPLLTAVRRRSIDMNGLMTVAMLGALAVGEAREAAILAVLFRLALTLERRSLERTGHAIRALLDAAPATARVERDGQVREVAVDGVAPGERVRLRPGDRVPLDGIVREGRSAVDEAAITGESVPAAKGPGDRVYAGSLALDGALTIEVTAGVEDSTLAKVVAMVEAAELEPSPTARVVDRFAAWYTPTVVLLAVLTALGGAALGLAVPEAIHRGLVLLVIGCPCALVIATPVAVYSGLTAAARRGALVRGGEPLEALGQVRVVAFDKTGTLTRGRPAVDVVRVLDDRLDERDCLALAAGLEAESSHPLAGALRAAAAQAGVEARVAASHIAEPGRGVHGEIDGCEYRLGNLGYVAADDDTAAVVAQLEAAGRTALVFAAERSLCVFGLLDHPRDGSAEAIAALRREGLAVALLTGDNPATAQAVAAQAGIEEVHARLLPEDKQRLLAELSARYGPAAMVGDGINDAPALASAAVGIALGAAGSDLALETADVALLGDDVRVLAPLVRLARAVRRTIAVNLALAIAIRVVLVPLALTGLAGLPLAILGDMGGSLLVTANSLRLLRSH